MNEIWRWLRVIALPLMAASTVSACATSRSVIDVSAASQESVSALATGPAHYAKITGITDRRKFEHEPNDPSIPSLSDPEELKDQKIVARAVGRKRNTFGKALGDIMLPENDSVAEVVRRSLASALKQKGYVVVEPHAPEYARAMPVEIDVTQFWAWLSPGFASLPMRCDWSVTLTSPELIGPAPVTLKGRADHSTAAAFESEWAKVINLGISDLTAKLREAIKSPPVAAGVPTS